MPAGVSQVYCLLHETIAWLASATARAERKQNACHDCLRDACALGIFLNTKTFFQRHQQKRIGVLHGHRSSNGAQRAHEQQAFLESEPYVLGYETV
jgi:hypothetical protein